MLDFLAYRPSQVSTFITSEKKSVLVVKGLWMLKRLAELGDHVFICRSNSSVVFWPKKLLKKRWTSYWATQNQKTARKVPPWPIWCCLMSYYKDKNDIWGSRTYRIHATEIRDWAGMLLEYAGTTLQTNRTDVWFFYVLPVCSLAFCMEGASCKDAGWHALVVAYYCQWYSLM